MKEYVVWFEFDDEFTDFLKEKCRELEKHEIEPGIRPPHLTLTFLKTEEEEKLIQYTRKFLQENRINIMIDSIGAFSNGVLFYSPKVSKKLLELHSSFCQQISEFGELTWDLYCPENWTPHIALTGILGEKDAVKSFSIMQKGFKGMNVTLKRIVIKSEGKEVANIKLSI